MAATQEIPEILLLCMDKAFISAFNDALATHWPRPAISITAINDRLNSLDPATTFDLIVSPANSYGRLDGAFDHAISMAFSPREDYHALTRAVQRVLYERWRGFAPPGTCTLVPFPAELTVQNNVKNTRACNWVAICPTMREPHSVVWDREVVYECVWSLLCEVEGWNRRNESTKKIRRILMTPLATGIGKVSKERWAAQVVLAMKHFVDALEKPERWGNLQWDDIESDAKEVESTWELV
ncbi:hypothetical protein ASPZODRAFT_123046 [Penicilliopsis zonata CBS 506.65]|uniref:Macro-like domain-containing protein n=1 Tax=Penicilliopsis zonata CBS 506.65 TaxID=1073090 RepID=A0A1L9S9N9_9EURO|nr:hypothetical protein ASPZODRAFT_123046 [Penicilliopsis zonata CBS 506.65]OJJ43874.1 hypothetical protein ASPZODRAFT_123046 [Penicilliopsis zonata CBS 506.65]